MKKELTRPYWEKALGERAKQVPRLDDALGQTAEEIEEGALNELPLYNLLIKPNTLEELEELLPEKKEHEPRLGILPERARIYKPAFFEFRGRQWPVRIRFRGDSPFHWSAKKQSWRVKFPRDDPFNGARRIDLINPKSPNMITDYLAMWLAKRMGLLAPDIAFVNLKVNHRLMGVYQETEQIDSYFLENNGRPEGNIYGEKDKKPKWYGEYPLYTDVVFWRKHCDDKTQAPDDYTELEQLLRVLNDPSEEVFVDNIFDILDRERFFIWNCHALLSSSGHQDWFHNARLYFDPTRGLFELIPWDISGFWLPRGFFFDTPSKVGGMVQYNPLSGRVLRHGPFRYKRDRLLWSYVGDPGLLNELLREANATTTRIRAAVQRDSMKESIGAHLTRETLTDKVFEESSEDVKRVMRVTFNRIRDALQFKDLKADIALLNAGEGTRDTQGRPIARLGLVNSASSAAALKSLRLPVKPESAGGGARQDDLVLFEDADNDHRFGPSDREIARLAWNEEEKIFSCDGLESFVYPELNEDLQPVSTRKDYFIVLAGGARVPDIDVATSEIGAENAVTGEPIQTPLQMVDDHLDGLDIPRPRTISEFCALYHDFPCSIVGGNRIAIAPGDHRISRTIVVPEGAILEIPGGVTLRFAPGCSLVSYGRLEARGTSRAPVRFTADDPQAGWGVVALWQAGADGSTMEHCVVEYGGEARILGGYFTGALSAYHASVAVRDCLFRKNRGDDALNCKYADGTVARCVFRDNAADAIDFDYCEGSVTDSAIMDSGNDGVDCGTASPLIEGNLIASCGDKGISAGERSCPLIANNVIRGCTIGIASKDMSDPVVANNVLLDNRSGIALYRKKPMYEGGGRALIVNSIIWGGHRTLEKDHVSDYRALHCSIEGGAAGTGNVDTAPDFIDPATDNYMLKRGSPLAAAGADPGPRASEILGISPGAAPIGLAKPLEVPGGGGRP